MKTHHIIKILPIYYEYVREGRKTFELRINDRNYRSADLVTLKEFDHGIFSGRQQTFEIGYVLKLDDFGLDGYVVFSLLEVLE